MKMALTRDHWSFSMVIDYQADKTGGSPEMALHYRMGNMRRKSGRLLPGSCKITASGGEELLHLSRRGPDNGRGGARKGCGMNSSLPGLQ